QVAAAVVVLQLGQEDRLVPAALVQRQLHADHVRLVHGDAEVRGTQVAADLLEVLHGGAVRCGPGAILARWKQRLPGRGSWPRCARSRAARWPATVRSRAAPDCRGVHAWWPGSCPATATPRCRGTGCCAAMAGLRWSRAATAGASRRSGCARRAWKW